MFLDVISDNKKALMNEIKLNKEFSLKLIDDLSLIFRTNKLVEDSANGCIIYTRATPINRNYYGSYKFIINEKGIIFIANCLGYRVLPKTSTIKTYGVLYEKYKNGEAIGDVSFLNDSPQPHGWVEFRLKIDRNSIDLKSKLLDIITIYEMNNYVKIW